MYIVLTVPTGRGEEERLPPTGSRKDRDTIFDWFEAIISTSVVAPTTFSARRLVSIIYKKNQIVASRCPSYSSLSLSLYIFLCFSLSLSSLSVHDNFSVFFTFLTRERMPTKQQVCWLSQLQLSLALYYYENRRDT